MPEDKKIIIPGAEELSLVMPKEVELMKVLDLWIIILDVMTKVRPSGDVHDSSFKAGVLLGKADLHKMLSRAWERLEKIENVEMKLTVFKSLLEGLAGETSLELEKFWKDVSVVFRKEIDDE